MADIDVRCSITTDGWRCDVAVANGRNETRHTVTLLRVDLQRLSPGGADPERLVRRSFEFLLEREPKESILTSFDLPAIGRYFADYEEEIRRRG